MTVQTEKEFYIETKHYVYVDYTIRARDKEHALEQFENGSYDDINTDYGVYDEQIAVSYTHLTLPTKRIV